MATSLDFEKPITDLENSINELRQLSADKNMDIVKDVQRLEAKLQKLMYQTYARLLPWQKVQVARHPERPHCVDYIQGLIEDFVELAGDRAFAEDRALMSGLGRFRGVPVMVLGTEKGHDIETRLLHNFGMPRPEGYRKANRLMKMADHFNLPLLTFVDTAGANPGKEAEERGQAEAIARSIETMLDIRVPVITVITGEGGSGGAVAIAVANHILMLEHSIYSVVSPEGCASILWRNTDKKQEAAAAQKLTAQDLEALEVINGVIPEPLGGAQRSPKSTISAVGDEIEKALRHLMTLDPQRLRQDRRQKFLNMGQKGLS